MRSLLNWFTGSAPAKVASTVSENPEIDWANPKAKISKYFTVHEATYLPQWDTYHSPSTNEKLDIIKTAKAMDLIREFLNMPVNVHCWIRPNLANCPGFDKSKVKINPADPRREIKVNALRDLDYNAFIGGARASAHIMGKAVDWSCKLSCDSARALLVPKLEAFGICCEDLPGSSWVHIDTLPPRGGSRRFFKP